MLGTEIPLSEWRDSVLVEAHMSSQFMPYPFMCVCI